MAPQCTKPNKGSHLTRDERAQISLLKQQGYSKRAIARALGRSPATICRELQRNICQDGRYRIDKAERRARIRQRLSRRNRRLTEDQAVLISRLLAVWWSPQQISQALRMGGVAMVCHESIYQYIREDRLSGGNLCQYLRCFRKKRRKRHGTYDSRGRLPGKRMIDDRPAAIDSRLEFGHFEGDTVLGKGRECILTLVERKSRLTLIGFLRNRTVAEVNAVAMQLLRPFKGMVKTITFDNGTEFHGYKELETALGIDVYFAHPYHSWERGTNENTNGLIRQFLPKRMTMFGLTQTRCVDIMRLLNNRPRKCLNYNSPAQVLFEALGVAV